MSIRRIHRKDGNQDDIVKALRKIGCGVEIIGKPVDLLVGYRARCFLLECKCEGQENRKDQQKQRDWMRDWPGHVRVVRDVEEAIKVVTESYR